MNRLKKIRGQKRVKKNIERWRNDYLQPNLDLIKEKHYDYVKIWVSPFDNLRYKVRNYTGPKSINRILILNALFDIYENWDMQLKKLNIPYYLKIWLYEPRVTSSQIVCGIEDRIEHYENVFLQSIKKSQFPIDRYKCLAKRINQYTWTSAIDEDIIDNDFCPKEQYLCAKDYSYDQKMFKRLEARNIRKENLSNNTSKLVRYYVPKGLIWVGNKK